MKVAFFLKLNLHEKTRNLNAYQRLYYLSNHVEMTVLTSKYTVFNKELIQKVKVVRSFSINKKLDGLSYFIFGVLYLFKLKKQNFRIVYTDRSVYSVFGLFGKVFLKLKWVADIWDDPEKESYYLYRRYSLGWIFNRLKVMVLKRILRYSDLVVCSIIPERLISYGLSPKRILALPNCIDLEVTKPAG